MAEAWEAQIRSLCGKYTVIAIDMLGHGQSPRPSCQMTLADYVQTVVPVLQTLSEPALVIGHSMGAMIALELACCAPEKVSGVVALNAIFERGVEATLAVQARASELDGATSHDPSPTLQRWFGNAASTERSNCERWLRTVDPKGYKFAYSAFAHANGPSREALQALTCPALLATGEHEPNSTPAMSYAMAKFAPQGRTLIIEGAAHMMPMTHANEVNTALLSFAQEVFHEPS
jgi:pimeloyl-ACP methyl ester carboxylesterase